MTISIQQMIDKEKEIERKLQEELRLAQENVKKIQEDLLVCRGKIIGYGEVLSINTQDDTNRHMTSPIHSLTTTLGDADGGQKRRAPRTSKKEMQRRRRIIGRILYKEGAMGAMDILPLAEEVLGYAMEIHHLRNVLYKFKEDFSQGEEHGMWELMEEAKTYFASHSTDVEEEISDSDTE